MRDDGIYIIMEHLLENNNLKVLDLNANEISFKGCEAIAKYLKSPNCSLESLHLATNKVSDYGAKAIAQAISQNKSLVHLDLTYNDIKDYGLFQTPREAPWFPDFVVYWVDDHFEMAYLETNIEQETDLGIDIYVSK